MAVVVNLKQQAARSAAESGLSEHRSACLGRGGYCLRPGFCGLGEDLLQCLLATRKVTAFTGMIEFPSVCHVLF